MKKEDKFLIIKGEIISEIVSSGTIQKEKLQEFKTFMEGNFAITEQAKSLVYTEVIKMLSQMEDKGENLQAVLEDVKEVFSCAFEPENIVSVLAFMDEINSKSYADCVESVNSLKAIKSNIPIIDLTRARVLLSVAISNGDSKMIADMTAELKMQATLVETEEREITWETNNV